MSELDPDPAYARLNELERGADAAPRVGGRKADEEAPLEPAELEFKDEAPRDAVPGLVNPDEDVPEREADGFADEGRENEDEDGDPAGRVNVDVVEVRPVAAAPLRNVLLVDPEAGRSNDRLLAAVEVEFVEESQLSHVPWWWSWSW